MRVCCVMVLMGVEVMSALAGVGQWKTYTAKREVRDVAISSLRAWVATSGGVFSSFLPIDSSVTEYTTSEGLKTNDLTAVTLDNSGTVWIGAANGFVHRYHPNTNAWEYVADIALRSDPNRRINGLQAVGDTLFILSDLGVSLFSISKMEFIATYARFGAGANPIIGNVTSMKIFNGNLWIGTRNGLAFTPLTNTNPSAPESWQVYNSIPQGIPSNNVSSLATIDTTLFAGTANGLTAYNGTTWNPVSGTGGLNILGISGKFEAEHRPGSCPSLAYRSRFYFITSSDLWGYDLDSALVKKADSGFPSNLTTISPTGLLGTQSSGIVYDFRVHQFPCTGGPDTAHYVVSYAPPGPPSNKFVGIAIDQKGAVWSGTGTANGDGFMSYDGHTWRSYTVGIDSRLLTNNYYKVSIGKDNAKWVSSWGAGVALLDDGGNLQRVFNTTSGLPPSIGSGQFVVVGGTATDENGVTWITNRTGRGDTALTTFFPDSSLRYVLGVRTQNPFNVFTDLVIDDYGTKWFSNAGRFEPEAPLGFFFYNDRFNLPGTVNGWGKLSASDGLTSDKVWSVAVDHDGDVWVGSDQGISIILNPQSPRSQIATYHPLRDQVIQAIVVDALNNKWIATKQGVFVLSSDGTSILDRYSQENTDGKLLDNDVASIAINHATGMVYFGTEKGLSSLTTSAVTPNRAFDGLTIAPNPFYLPASVPLLITGLVANSSMKILSIDGNLVKEIKTPGGQVGFWDGRNERGDLVASAIYLVVAYSEDGTKVATGKVAVVRR